VLIAVADGYRTPLAVYTATLVAMFTTSALYHRGHWSAAGRKLWKRLDHSMIFLAIAGGYTAYCAIALPPSLAITILGIVWAGALVGPAGGVGDGAEQVHRAAGAQQSHGRRPAVAQQVGQHEDGD
jgi:channel protein (hemolysin III family)